ncbi:hypothetical protein QQF64_024532 [Cirrhinus molitorella]|uniref:Secreted protein n=1 Tax=Cirrhinus molitorella TaxID=172907 RepID=A0ABR3NLG9_9TELE
MPCFLSLVIITMEAQDSLLVSHATMTCGSRVSNAVSCGTTGLNKVTVELVANFWQTLSVFLFDLFMATRHPVYAILLRSYFPGMTAVGHKADEG